MVAGDRLVATPTAPNEMAAKQAAVTVDVPYRSRAMPVKNRNPCVLHAPAVKAAPKAVSEDHALVLLSSSLSNSSSPCKACRKAGHPYTMPAVKLTTVKEYVYTIQRLVFQARLRVVVSTCGGGRDVSLGDDDDDDDDASFLSVCGSFIIIVVVVVMAKEGLTWIYRAFLSVRLSYSVL